MNFIDRNRDSRPESRERRGRRDRVTRNMWRLSVVLVLSLLSLGFSQIAEAQVTIQVTTTLQGLSDPANCSLQEAIYSSEFKTNIALATTRENRFYTTGCVPGTGNGDTIVLPAGGSTRCRATARREIRYWCVRSARRGFLLWHRAVYSRGGRRVSICHGDGEFL